jgi:hypothetical protein
MNRREPGEWYVRKNEDENQVKGFPQPALEAKP